MRKFQAIKLTVVCLLGFLAAGSWGLYPAQSRQIKPEIPDELIQYASEINQIELMVELHQPPLAVFKQQSRFSFLQEYRSDLYKNQLHKFRQKLIHNFQMQPIPFEVTYQYHLLFNGFTVKTDGKGFEALSEHPDIKKLYGVNEYYLHREYSVPAVSAPQAWEIRDKNGDLLSGKDILVGIIDTGIDYWHGDLGGGIGQKPDGSYYKIRGGYDFAEMHPNPNDGVLAFHGTHVAGIVAGNGEPGIANGYPVGKGVAPEASLMAYKVFTSSRRSTGGSAIIMALEAAVNDGCHVVNLSLGKFFGWTEDPLSLVCDRAAEAGVIVVASAGNDGLRNNSLNLFPLSSPSSGLKVISVASSDETLKPGFIVRKSDQSEIGTFPGQMLMYSPPLPETQEMSLVHIKGQGESKDYQGLEVEGKAVLVQRGGLSFKEKTLIAKKAKAMMIIIYNHVGGSFSGTLGEEGDYIPAMAISKEDGLMLKKIFEDDPDSILRFDYSQIPVMSSFSAQGPTPDFYLKPDLTAPGSSILSCAPGGTGSFHQNYSYASGTSMSAPHVAGGAALLKQLHPEWTPAEIKSLLVNYVDILNQPQSRQPYSVYWQGAGRMNLEKAAKGTLVADPVNITFFQVDPDETVDYELTITNKGTTPAVLKYEVWTDDPGYTVHLNIPQNHSLDVGESQILQVQLAYTEEKIPATGHREFRLFLSYGDQTMIIPGIFWFGSMETMDQVVTAFSYPNLAISPNNDGSADYNYFYFLSPYIIDGVQVSLYDYSGEKHLGVLDYVRARMGSGYFRVIFSGSVIGKGLPDGMYTFRSYILPKGGDYKKKEDWVTGKESKVLIDTVEPKLTLEMKRINLDTLQIEGKVEDDNISLGAYLYYEIDDEEFSQVALEADRSFKHEISINSDHFFIRFTAQDLAGNRTSIKKRIPSFIE